MMPVQVTKTENESSTEYVNDILETSVVLDFDMEGKKLDTSSIGVIHEKLENINLMPKFQQHDSNISKVVCESSFTSQDQHVALMKYVGISNYCASSSCSNHFMCLRNSEKILDKHFKYTFSDNFISSKKTVEDLNKLSITQLQLLVDDLSQAVEKVSSELVQLLLENDALQQETDARNVVIEQLLKLTVKITENELRPIQMSIVLPSDDCDDI